MLKLALIYIFYDNDKVAQNDMCRNNVLFRDVYIIYIGDCRDQGCQNRRF